MDGTRGSGHVYYDARSAHLRRVVGGSGAGRVGLGDESSLRLIADYN
jgi:hypothetical protein